jgi:hypothetical protein
VILELNDESDYDFFVWTTACGARRYKVVEETSKEGDGRLSCAI